MQPTGQEFYVVCSALYDAYICLLNQMHSIASEVKHHKKVVSSRGAWCKQASSYPLTLVFPWRTVPCITFLSKKLSIYSISKPTRFCGFFLIEDLQQTSTTACLGYSMWCLLQLVMNGAHTWLNSSSKLRCRQV